MSSVLISAAHMTRAVSVPRVSAQDCRAVHLSAVSVPAPTTMQVAATDSVLRVKVAISHVRVVTSSVLRVVMVSVLSRAVTASVLRVAMVSVLREVIASVPSRVVMVSAPRVAMASVLKAVMASALRVATANLMALLIRKDHVSIQLTMTPMQSIA